MLIDPEAVARFAPARFEAFGRPVPDVTPPAETFGDSPEPADELLELVINGPKRATAERSPTTKPPGIRYPRLAACGSPATAREDRARR